MMPEWNGPRTPPPPVGFQSWWEVPQDHEARERLGVFQRQLDSYLLTQETVRPWWKRIFGGRRYEVPLYTACAVQTMKDRGMLEGAEEFRW